MKKIFTSIIIICAIVSQINAQRIEIKTSPTDLFLLHYSVAAETEINNKWSIDLSGTYGFYQIQKLDFNFSLDGGGYSPPDVVKSRGTQLSLKYCFKTFGLKKNKKYFIGPYIGLLEKRSYIFKEDLQKSVKAPFYNKNRLFSVGSLVSYKYYSAENFMFEIGLGLGIGANQNTNIKATSPELRLDYTSRIAVGYRFGSKNNE